MILRNKYPTAKCSTCGDPIAVGDEIDWNPRLPTRKRVRHPDCEPTQLHHPDEPRQDAQLIATMIHAVRRDPTLSGEDKRAFSRCLRRALRRPQRGPQPHPDPQVVDINAWRQRHRPSGA